MDDFEWMFEAAEALNCYQPPEAPRAPSSSQGGLKGDRPGDDFNRRAGWPEVLEKHGWKAVGRCGEKVYWRRPGKKEGWSATTGYCRSDLRGDLFFPFSSNSAPFEEDQSYSKFEAYAVLEHGGNWKDAAQMLADQGYGRQAPITLILPQPQPLEVAVPVFHPLPGNGNSNSEPPQKVAVPVPAPPLGNGNSNFGAPLPGPSPAQPAANAGWPLPIPSSQLRRLEANEKWIVHGWLSRSGVTMMAALWKAGKTTLLSHLLKAFEAGEAFCGLAVKPSRVLYVSEEDETTWAERRDELGLRDHLEFIPRPFRGRPTLALWVSFLTHLAELVRERKFDLVVFDTISKLWPVRDENEAPAVENALLPVYALTDANAAVLIVHHMRKGDGGQATGARGSGALPAFVETILELRRFEPGDMKDPRRVITGYGRYRETPQEMVVRLSESGFEALGESGEVRKASLAEEIAKLLPRVPPGYAAADVQEKLEARRKDVLEALENGVTLNRWRREGKGKARDPFTYWRPFSEQEEREARRQPYNLVMLALRTRGPSSLASIAAAVQSSERLAEEWLEQLACEGRVAIFDHPGGRVYELKGENTDE